MKKQSGDIIILHSCNINDNHMMYGSRNMDHFYPPNNPKNQNLQKMKKPPGDIITLHRCSINDNHIMYGS